MSDSKDQMIEDLLNALENMGAWTALNHEGYPLCSLYPEDFKPVRDVALAAWSRVVQVVDKK
jgi:hypothetical protein